MFDCILLMAGSGKRSGLNYNKIEYKINGKPIYQYSIDTFLKVKGLSKIILVVRSEDYNRLKKLEKDNIIVTKGDDLRWKSVNNGLKKTSEEIVLIHDAARPNVKIEDIDKVYSYAKKRYSCFLGVKCKDSLKEVRDGLSASIIDRDNVWIAQTPQAVNRTLLIDAFKNNKIDFKDDVEALQVVFGMQAKAVLGSDDNIKVTTMEDIKYMEFLLGVKNEK